MRYNKGMMMMHFPIIKKGLVVVSEWTKVVIRVPKLRKILI